MSESHFARQLRHAPSGATNLFLILLAAIVLASVGAARARAESAASKLVIRAPENDAYDPFEEHWPAAPVDAAAYLHHRLPARPKQANFQIPQAQNPANETSQPAAANDPCAALTDRPLAELGIGIAVPDGEMPSDHATACWNQLNQSAGPLAAFRLWSTFGYHWNATCLCHRPLYFEQINLERHGYGCCETLQPLASGAHFFGTVLALPYCMAVECPCECVYTLGHYRPGSCPPWRHHWPPCSPLAAAAEGGVWTGMIFLIP